MTARDSYRDPVTPAEAVAELRRVSGTQLDGELVELFIKLLERKGVAFHHGDDADFESELDLERRIRQYAEPRAVVAG
jgi:HD-GYP domain-containing protein (c-di-GMP phosphodiesterase class II)